MQAYMIHGTIFWGVFSSSVFSFEAELYFVVSPSGVADSPVWKTLRKVTDDQKYVQECARFSSEIFL